MVVAQRAQMVLPADGIRVFSTSVRQQPRAVEAIFCAPLGGNLKKLTCHCRFAQFVALGKGRI
jgi:hypothetical protein